MCDALCALPPATTGATLFAKSSDRPPDEAQRLEWLPPRRDDGRLRVTHIEVEPFSGQTIGVLGARPWWQWGLEHGVNEAGVAAGNETIYTTLDPRGVPPALIGMDLVRLALERASTAASAVEVLTSLLERYGQGGTGHHGVDRPYWSSFLVADAGDAWVIETSGRTWAAEQVSRVRAISNRTTIPAFDAEHRHPRQPVERLVDPRWHAGIDVLSAEPVTVPALLRHLRSHTGQEGFTVCMHAGDIEATTASVVAELTGRRSLGRWCLASPCTSVYVPLWVGPIAEPVAWERFAALRSEHRPVLDELEASLAADAADDPAWPAEAWRRIEAVLDRCGVPAPAP